MKGGRNLTVDGTVYRYRVGKSMTIIRRQDNTVFAKVATWKLKNPDDDVYTRGQWKRSSDGAITPGDVTAYIKRTT